MIATFTFFIENIYNRYIVLLAQFLHVLIVQEARIHQSHVYGWIKISQTIFEKGHWRNIPLWNYFKIGPAVLEKKIFKNFLMYV